MSVNGKASCATCHKQELAFTDGRPVAVGGTGEKHVRSSMSLVNVAYGAVLTWSDPRMKDLERQALVPMFGEHPVELGLREGDGFLPMIRSDRKYRDLFELAFGKFKAPFMRNIALNGPYMHDGIATLEEVLNITRQGEGPTIPIEIRSSAGAN